MPREAWRSIDTSNANAMLSYPVPCNHREGTGVRNPYGGLRRQVPPRPGTMQPTVPQRPRPPIRAITCAGHVISCWDPAGVPMCPNQLHHLSYTLISPGEGRAHVRTPDCPGSMPSNI